MNTDINIEIPIVDEPIIKKERKKRETKKPVKTKEEKRASQTKYRETHPLEKSGYNKKYYDNHKATISDKSKELITCAICNKSFRKCAIARHNKTKVHLKSLAILETPII